MPERRDDAVTVAYVHPNEVAHSWHMSLVEMIGHDLSHDGRIIRGGWIAIKCGTDGLAAARNKAVEQFLADDRADWLFWIDTDMGFAPDTVDRLLEVADPVERPIVGALCFAQRERHTDGMGGYRCTPASTVFDWVSLESGMGFLGRAQYPVNTLVRAAGTGAACILIHRSAFEKIRNEHGPIWYDRIKNPTTRDVQRMGEDLSFCLRAGALNIPIFVHTGVKTTHYKNFWLGEQDFWNHAVPPPATEKTAVIVPVVKRSHNAAPFMESLRASTGMATVYAIADPDDDEAITAWKAAGAVVITSQFHHSPGSFAEKVNLGYAQTSEPWLFLTGDDVRFHPGWLDHAQAVAGTDVHVVGTNDLGNPRVTSGEHAVHFLVRRSYADEVGASWDGPGVVAHEGYRHWFVDDEIVNAAKARGVWAMALASTVEHLHPNWGKADDDEVYQIGGEHAAKDRRTFQSRASKHLGGGRG